MGRVSASYAPDPIGECPSALDAGDDTVASDGECTRLWGTTLKCTCACAGVSGDGSGDSHTAVVGLGASPAGSWRSNDAAPISSSQLILSALDERAYLPGPYANDDDGATSPAILAAAAPAYVPRPCGNAYAVPPLTLAASERRSVREGRPAAFVSVSRPGRLSDAARTLPGYSRGWKSALRTGEKERAAAAAGWIERERGGECAGSLQLDDVALPAPGYL